MASCSFVSPPRSPKLNGRVGRANRTYREEFYNCSEATPTVAGFRADLLNWEHTYNHIRPHQAAPCDHSGMRARIEYLTSASGRRLANPVDGVGETVLALLSASSIS